ncbi:MAG: KpsF/GutQ family sugar-phosphate isomerase [Planctomycetaceae bacterium]
MPDPADDLHQVIPLNHVDQLWEARAIIRREAEALLELADHLEASFCDAVQLIQRSSGSVIVTGVGKAGLIGQKIVATMASTGTRASFLHPTEAVHGDLGCVASNDVVLALSNSGRSEEVLRLLPVLGRLNIPIIAITRDHDNPLAGAAQVVLAIGRHTEAGELKLAPTTSTTAMLAMGDALSLVLSKAKGFTENDFAMFHPAGALGRKLQPVDEVMRRGADFRVAMETDTVRHVMIELSRPGRRTGAVVLTKPDGRLSGIFTDSDLARLFEQRREHLVDRPIAEVMTVNPTTIRPHCLLPEALHLMAERKLSELPVVDASGVPLGLIDITDVIDCSATDLDHSVIRQRPDAGINRRARSA